MVRSVVVLGIGILLAGPAAAYGQAIDARTAQALELTLQAIGEPAAGGLSVARDLRALELDRRIRTGLGSDELRQEVQELAERIVAELRRAGNGNLAQVSQALERARSDPSAFAATLPPEVHERLRALAATLAGPRP